MAKNAHSTPTSNSSPSRRSLFGGAAAVIIGSGVTAGIAASVADFAPPSADAELIAIGAQARPIAARYDRLLAGWWTIKSGDPRLERCAAEMDGPHGRLCDLADRVLELPASTPEGWQAKAVLIRHLMTLEHNSNGKMEFETFDQELIWSLICDMTGGSARA